MYSLITRDVFSLELHRNGWESMGPDSTQLVEVGLAFERGDQGQVTSEIGVRGEH